MDKPMLISVVTVSFNNIDTIGETILSVLCQDYISIEYLVVDGGSSDGTVELLKSYGDQIKWISESDNGIYDAMNKGIALATGDIIGTLNADDFYANDHVLSEVSRIFLDPNINACYGDLVYVSEVNAAKTVRFWKSNNYKSGLFKSGWMPAHPTFFVRKNVYEQLGKFNLNYKIAADFELLFRFIEKNKVKTRYLPKVLIKMRLGGTTNKSISNIINQNKEIIAILRDYYVDFTMFKFIVKKLINRSFQFYYGYKFRIFGN